MKTDKKTSHLIARHPARRMHLRSIFTLTIALIAAFLANVEVASAQTPVAEEKAELVTMSAVTLEELYREQPAARAVIARSAGYAVFSSFGAKLGIAGTGKGKGLATNNKTKQQTFMKMLELQAGLGFGIKKYRLVWVFESQDAFDAFITTGRQIGGQAAFSAKTSKDGSAAAGAASVDAGVWLYQLTDKGLAAEITVKASKYFKDKDLN